MAAIRRLQQQAAPYKPADGLASKALIKARREKIDDIEGQLTQRNKSYI